MRPPQTVDPARWSRSGRTRFRNHVSAPETSTTGPSCPQTNAAVLATAPAVPSGPAMSASIGKQHGVAIAAVTNPPTNAGPVLTGAWPSQRAGHDRELPSRIVATAPKKHARESSTYDWRNCATAAALETAPATTTYAAADPSAKDSVRRAATSRGASAVNASSATKRGAAHGPQPATKPAPYATARSAAFTATAFRPPKNRYRPNTGYAG